MKQNKSKKDKGKKVIKRVSIILFYVVLYSGIGFGAFALGMIYEQILISQQLGLALSYADIDVNVNFNETKLVEEMNKSFIPAWREVFNETLQNKLGCTTRP